MVRRSVAAVWLGAALSSAALLAAGQALTRQDSASMQRKLETITARGVQPHAGTPALKTSFTEREVNAYFKYDGQPHLPVGVVDPQIVIKDGGQLEGRATVDLDAVRKAQSNAMLNLLALFAGSVEVRAVGRLQTANGKGTFLLDSATVAGLPVPKSVLQSVVTHYSKNPDLPDGFDLDKPFDLPAAIRSVELQRGSATIIQ